MDITAAQQRLLRALAASVSPLGATPLGLAKALGITPSGVSEVSKSLEGKGFCTRERVGMRIYLRVSAAGLALLSLASIPDDTASPGQPIRARHCEGSSTESGQQTDISPDQLLESQREILAAVARAQTRVATSRLVELTGLTNRAVHRQASRLYAKGLLSRVREERRWVWALTGKGIAHLAGKYAARTARVSIR